jgi:hypothetical protein
VSLRGCIIFLFIFRFLFDIVSRNIFLMAISLVGLQPMDGAIEVLMDSYINITQHKSSDGRLRLEVSAESHKAGYPAFTQILAKEAGEELESEIDQTQVGFDVADMREAISSGRGVVYDSDGDRELVDQRDAIIPVSGAASSSSSGGGGGGCLLRSMK